mmetsp:Transcript_907/g.1967  ORF Transcript_907/g.1967 Transcript_907/m.1967 type:complete len:201 (+) Transcript_907:3355-3957(+)
MDRTPLAAGDLIEVSGEHCRATLRSRPGCNSCRQRRQTPLQRRRSRNERDSNITSKQSSSRRSRQQPNEATTSPALAWTALSITLAISSVSLLLVWQWVTSPRRKWYLSSSSPRDRRGSLLVKRRPVGNRCFQCGGFGLVRCGLCRGEGVVFLQARRRHYSYCPLCSGSWWVDGKPNWRGLVQSFISWRRARISRLRDEL